MRYLWITIIAIFISLPSMAQVFNLNAHIFSSLDAEGEFKDFKIDLPITIDFGGSRLIIHSAKLQIVNYEVIRSYADEDGFLVTSSIGRDLDDEEVFVTIAINSKRKLIRVGLAYEDVITYMYSCTLAD